MTQDDLDRAEQITRLMQATFAAMWTNWPNAQCAPSSLLLAPVLRASFADEAFRVTLGEGHIWVESNAGDVIDPTYGQFTGKGSDPLLIVPAGGRRPPKLRKVSRKLTLPEEQTYRENIGTRYDQHHDEWFSTGTGIKEAYWK